MGKDLDKTEETEVAPNRAARNFTASLGPLLREETFQGRKHLVAPVVALREGVIQAMNAETPEFVAAQTLSDPKTLLGFNGRPLFLGHPMKDGEPTPGNTPELLEKSAFGTLFNTTSRKKKITTEAWVDIEKANEVDPSIVKRLRKLNKDQSEDNEIEVSVGVFVDMDENATGVYDGKKYQGEWKNIVPDHLAFLEDGHTGACSCEMGCGVRTARAATEETVTSMYLDWLEPGEETEELIKSLRNIPQEERDKMPAADFAGPNKSFPIAKPEDVAAAAHSVGRAKGGPSARAKIKTKIISIAYRKGDNYVAQLPETWKKKADQKSAASKAGFFDNLKASLRGVFKGAISSTESDRDIRDSLMETLREMEPNSWDIVAVYSDRVIYSVFESGGACLYQRAYTGDETAGYTLDGNRVEVEPVTTFEIVDLENIEVDEQRTAASKQNMIQQMHDHAVTLGATCASEMKSAEQSSKPCSCGGLAPTAASSTSETDKIDPKLTEGEIDMTKTERIAALLGNKHNLVKDQKALEAASDETLAVLESHCDAQKVAEDKAIKDAADKIAADAKVVEDAKLAAAAAKKVTDDAEAAKLAAASTKQSEPLTEEEWIKAAPKRLLSMIARQEASETARHAELVGALKAAQSEYTEDELKAFELPNLERMAKMVKVPAPVVDFSGRGIARPAEDSTAAPAPPDFNARVRAAQAAKTH